jgi:hypothetical protein
MIQVTRGKQRLGISQVPSRGYGIWTAAAGVVALAGFVVAWQLQSPFIAGVPAVLAVALLLGWTRSEHTFDRKTGFVLASKSGPLRAPARREIALVLVASLVERRAGGRRELALLLTDRSTLVVLRAGPDENEVFDATAKELSSLLRLPLELGDGVVLADRFEIESRVAQGGMGVVYRAHDRERSERVAVKLVSSVGKDRDRAKRFERESRLLADLDHPRIAKHLAHGMTAQGQAYLAMEWLDGGDLSETLESGALTTNESLSVLKAVAEALAVVHEHGLIHRDLKPSNLIARNESLNELVLLDFGVARDADSASLLTATTALIGTPHYMAPEQASNSRDISPAADVFSAGCIFYECLTGERPFEADQILGILARILYDNPQPLSALRPDLPEAWSSLLSRMLAKHPSERPKNGAELLREIELLPPAADTERPRKRAEVSRDEPEAGDQVLVCVVLATVAGKTPIDLGVERLESIQSALHRFGCPVERLGDGSLIAMVLPRPSAADQVRIAARCAMYLRDQLPKAKIAIATGRAPLGAKKQVGDAVDRAAGLLERTFDKDGIRLDDVSHHLLDQRFVTTSIDDFALLTGENPDLDESRPLLGKPTPCVGRELELIQLEGIVSSVVEEKLPKAAVVTAPPGAGKSRLRHELLRRVRETHPDVKALFAYGDPISSGSPYVLLADALRRSAGIHVGVEPARAQQLLRDELCKRIPSEERKRVSEFLGELAGVPFPDDDSPPLRAARGDHRVMSEQIALAFSDWLSAEIAVHPVAFVLEDLQWGDSLTVKLLDAALRDLGTGALFVLAVGRPEVEEIFPKLFGDRRALSLSLRPLSTRAGEQLVKGVLGDDLPKEELTRIVELSAGNALFLEELIRASAEGKGGAIPETVVAMLQARLSRLAPDARLALRAASVLGETFWCEGVKSIVGSWNPDKVEQADTCLALMMEGELVVRSRTTRFAGDMEYSFRHALVCDAARGLLSESDKRTAHLTAGKWLESVGETDAMVLARHAAEGGDRERATRMYARAAERSLELYDFVEALQRSALGIESGAKDELLGVFQCIQSSAHYSMGKWADSAEVGLSSLKLVPRGGNYWCSTVERLMQVLPNVGDLETLARLSKEMLEITPTIDARPAYVRALCAQLLGHALAGEHAKGKHCADLLEKLIDEKTERDIVLRGYLHLFRSVFMNILTDDLVLARTLAQKAQDDLKQSQVEYRLALAYIVESFCQWTLGDMAAAIHAAREGRSIAKRIRDDYHAALADWYLGLALSSYDEPEKLEEAEACVASMKQLDGSPTFVATTLSMSAGVAMMKKDWKRAEAEARESRDKHGGIIAYELMASRHLVLALMKLDRVEEAAEIARRDLALLNALPGTLWSDVTFRVAAAEALHAAGDQPAAVAALQAALQQMENRIAKIADPAAQALYRSRQDNQRALELQRSWLG